MNRICPRCFSRYDPATPACTSDGVLTVLDRVGMKLDDRFTLRDLVMATPGVTSTWRAMDHVADDDTFVQIFEGRDSNEREKFLARTNAVAAARHPHLFELRWQSITADGRPYLVVSFVKGDPLEVLLRRNALDYEASLRLSDHFLSALDVMHQRGVVHGGMSESHLFVELGDNGDRFGRINGLDVPRGGLADRNEDVYAMAKVIYKMMTGDVWVGEFDLHQHGVPIPVARVMEKALHASHTHRYRTAEDLRIALRSASQPASLDAPPGQTLPGMSAALVRDNLSSVAITGPRPTLRPQLEGPEALSPRPAAASRWHWVLAAVVLMAVGSYAIWKIAELGPTDKTAALFDEDEVDGVAIDDSASTMVSPPRPIQRTPTSAELAGSASAPAQMPAGKPARYMTIDERRVRVYDRPDATVEVPCLFTSEPSGARVMWNKTHLGHTPLQVNLPEGKQSLTLALSGYTERAITVPVYFGENGEPVERYVHLRP